MTGSEYSFLLGAGPVREGKTAKPEGKAGTGELCERCPVGLSSAQPEQLYPVASAGAGTFIAGLRLEV